MKTLTYYYGFLSSLVLVATVVSLYQASVAVLHAQQVSHLETEIALAQQTKQELTLRLAQQTSVPTLTSAAEGAGYQPFQHVAILEPATTVALR